MNIINESSDVFITVDGVHKRVGKVYEAINGIWVLRYNDPFCDILIDFKYSKDGNGNVRVLDWKGTLEGEVSTEIVIPDNPSIIL